MKRQPIPFRDLLERVLPVERLAPELQRDIASALSDKDPLRQEEVAMEALDQLVTVGQFRVVEEVLKGDEKIRRYRDLTTGNTIALRLPATDEDEGIFRTPLPLRGWKGDASLDQIRTLFSLYNKILTHDTQMPRGPVETLRQILGTVRQALGCDRVTFWGPPRGGTPPELGEVAVDAYDEDLAREAVLEQRCLVTIPEIPAEIDEAGEQKPEASRSLAMIPIGEADRSVYGVLTAWSGRPHFFTRDRQALLSLLSEFATDVVKRAEVLNNLVFVDTGTRIGNRAYYDLQIEREIARAKREKTTFALAIADIDDFKLFNTRYGYEGGNEVLANAALVLKNGLRPFDAVARWGGEEFAIILTAPLAGEDAFAICERLRQATEFYRFNVVGLSGESDSVQITLSIGGAMFPEDGDTAEALWASANRALVQAKSEGKNRVVFSSPPKLRKKARPR